MKKFLIALFVLSLLALSLTACGSDHDHTFGADYTVITEPTCTTPGMKAYKCIDCDEYQEGSEVAIPATHKWGTEYSVITPATCTQEGTKAVVCTICNAPNSATVNSIPVTGHNYGASATIDKAATCNEDGEKSIKCTVCNSIKEGSVTSIPASHAWADMTTLDFDKTCTENGQRSIKCKSCGETKPDSITVIPAGHSWSDEATVDIPATCTTAGRKSVKCITCEEKKEDTIAPIPASHTVDYATTIVPTIFNDGIKVGVCSVCGEEDMVRLNKTKFTEKVLTADTDGTTIKKINISSEVLKGEHFYPTEENPNGLDLMVELSLLYNETLERLNFGYIELAALANSGGSERDVPFRLVLRDGATSDDNDLKCTFAGRFDSHAMGDRGVISGPTMELGGEAVDFPAIGEYGWHRIGIRVHQEHFIDENDKVRYELTASLYVDGELISSYDFLPMSTSNLLYTATVINGDVEFEDISTGCYLYGYRIGYSVATGGNAHLIVADFAATASNSFVLDVESVENPAPVTETINGVDFDGRVFYKYDVELPEVEEEEELDPSINPLLDLQNPALDIYEYPMAAVRPAEGTIGYALPKPKDRKYMVYEEEKVAFIDITDTVFNTVSLKVGPQGQIWYSFLSEMPTLNGLPSYAFNYSTFETSIDDVTVTIPANAKYLVVYYQESNSVKFCPSAITFSKNASTPSEMLKNDTLNSYNYPMNELKPSQGTIRSTDNKYVPDNEWITAFIDITDCAFDKVTLTVNADTGFVGYGFLTVAPDIYDTVTYAKGYTSMVYIEDGSTNPGDSITLDIPEDATVLVVYYQNQGPVYYVPEAIVFSKNEEN